ncbi:MAG: hypothetical protein ACI837_000692 [Crocinitomicaceae bacterium]|jgi:hypothetical protein
MAFDGTEGGEITLSTGSDWTQNYRDQVATGATKGHFFGKDILTALLDQEGCVGIRMYYGIDDEEQKVLILAGANGEENDILELVADKSMPCPSRCGVANDLNS